MAASRRLDPVVEVVKKNLQRMVGSSCMDLPGSVSSARARRVGDWRLA
jgi:hypothetical protein